MPIPSIYLAPLIENHFYHIYDKANENEILFPDASWYSLFHKKFDRYLSPFLDTFCFNLLPDHFHFLVRVKPTLQILEYLDKIHKDSLLKIEQKCLRFSSLVPGLIEEEIRRFLISYSMNYNKNYYRCGNLFHRPFKRLEIIKETHFTEAMVYIHANSVKHKITNDFTKYPWSSWNNICNKTSPKLCKSEILDWFGGLDQFINTHHQLSQFYYESEIAIEP